MDSARSLIGAAVSAPPERVRAPRGDVAPVPTVTARIESIDLLRGLVMILMALDHVREFFHAGTANPTDPATTTVALYFTRWVTHFCAPVFFLLTGTGAFVARRRRRGLGLARFLLIRGAWLIVLEIVVVRCFGFQFNADYRVTLLTVLWALGWAMIALALLLPLPVNAIAVVGLVMIGAHNVLDSIRASSLGAFAPLWTVLHSPGVVFAGPHLVFAAYPLVPWIGVTAAGYALGQVYDWHPARRRRWLWRAGAVATVAFLVLRAINRYGDPGAWTRQKSMVFTILSFLNTTKYPPSLLFLLMTLGPALCALAALDQVRARALRPALVFGRVPLFYFLVHLPLIHLLAVAICYVRYGDAHWMFESPRLDQYPFTRPPGWGFDLAGVFVVWVVVVVVLFPVCWQFAGFKQRHQGTWVRFL